MEVIQNGLIEAMHTLTGISAKKLIDYSKDHNVINVLHHPGVLGILPDNQTVKIAALVKMISAYQHLSEISNLNMVQLDSTSKAKNFFSGILSLNHDREYFMAVFLSTQNEVIDVLSLKGTVDSCPVYPRDVLQAALSHDAKAVMLGHNHPSGHSNPSREDLAATQQFVNIFIPLGINVLDHIIVGDNGAYSMAEHANLDFRYVTGDSNYNMLDLGEQRLGYEIIKTEYYEEWER